MEQVLTKHIDIAKSPPSLKEYEKAGGYVGVRKALKEMSPSSVISIIREANLLGRGGAGFPTGVKWSLIPSEESGQTQHYLIANADEMEPGAFKDRHLLEGNPHQLIAGMIVAAYAIRASKAYIFMRWAYKRAEKSIRRALAEAYEAGYLGDDVVGSGFRLDIYLHMSAGRYICGEESALINSLEGKRAVPRAKPPFPTSVGLFGKPTVINNVETLSWISHIVARGASWFRSLSLTGEGGTKLYGVSGRVRNPGLWELPMGTPLQEIIMTHAGGMSEGFGFRAVLPGGGSTDFLTAEHMKLNMDFATVQKAGSRLGTGTMTVLDDGTCPLKLIHNLIRFFALESCGWCTPCREGLPWVEKILASIEEGRGTYEDLKILEFQSKYMGPGKTFCAHAPGAMEPLQSGLRYFREDFERHIKEKRCPWKTH